MNSREKKLLGLVIVALILAAGNFFYSSLDKFEAVVSSDSKAESARSAVAQMSARMASMPLNAEARRRLAAANEPLKRDPLQAGPACRQRLKPNAHERPVGRGQTPPGLRVERPLRPARAQPVSCIQLTVPTKKRGHFPLGGGTLNTKS